MAEHRTVNPWVVGSSPTLGAMENFDNFDCIDCKVNTLKICEYYMVKNHVWYHTGLGPCDGMLCISCLENRIGRTLLSSDFVDLPINTTKMLRSPRLISRINNEHI